LLGPGAARRRRSGRHAQHDEFGGGLVWEFMKTDSLRPEILYTRDQSNTAGFKRRLDRGLDQRPQGVLAAADDARLRRPA
jgi:hypothetical protein